MGADYYENIHDECAINAEGNPSIGNIIRNTIVDTNARIGSNVRIANHQEREDCDDTFYSIRDGIVVIHKNAVIPNDTVI